MYLFQFDVSICPHALVVGRMIYRSFGLLSTVQLNSYVGICSKEFKCKDTVPGIKTHPLLFKIMKSILMQNRQINLHLVLWT